MPPHEKKKISAREVLTDIKAGMDARGLKTKYGLSDDGLNKVYGKLRTAGLLKEADPHHQEMLDPRKEQPTADRSMYMGWRCPACNAPQPERMEECPRCGAIASKVEGRFAPGVVRGRQFEEPVAEDAEGSGLNKLILVAASVIILFALGVVLIKIASRGTSTAPSGGNLASLSVSPAGSVQRFTTSNFDTQVTERSKDYPVLVQFHADW